MDLRSTKRIASTECFVCRWAGMYIVLWPQAPRSKPEIEEPDDYTFPSNKVTTSLDRTWTTGSWQVYINVHETIRGLRSKHEVVNACPGHWSELWNNWIQIAIDEVALETVWNNYIRRAEK